MGFVLWRSVSNSDQERIDATQNQQTLGANFVYRSGVQGLKNPHQERMGGTGVVGQATEFPDPNQQTLGTCWLSCAVRSWYVNGPQALGIVSFGAGQRQRSQIVKNPLGMRETWVQSLGWKGPLEEDVATHSGILAWRLPMDRGK